jgi:hypothetical protein
MVGRQLSSCLRVAKRQTGERDDSVDATLYVLRRLKKKKYVVAEYMNVHRVRLKQVQRWPAVPRSV